MTIKVVDVIPSQPYLGRPEQLHDMVEAVLAGAVREGEKIQLLKTPKGIYVYDGHCWCAAVYLASLRGGRDELLPEEFDLYTLGAAPCEFDMMILGAHCHYSWDGAGFVAKSGRGFNIYSMEKIRVDGKREYRKKTVQTLKELVSKYTTKT